MLTCVCATWAVDDFELMLAGNGHHYYCDHYAKPHEIAVLATHYDDWLKHPEYWATMENPEVSECEFFVFAFNGLTSPPFPKHVAAYCREVLPPGDRKGKYPAEFSNWWIVRYERITVDNVNAFRTRCDGNAVAASNAETSTDKRQSVRQPIRNVGAVEAKRGDAD